MLENYIAGEHWECDNYLLDLPGKWKYSLLAKNNDEVIAILIASLKSKDTIHIHRLLVNNSYQGIGIGKRMLKLLGESAQKDGLLFLTLKTSKNNFEAQKFYNHLGFKIQDSRSLNNISYQILLYDLIQNG